MKLLADLHTHSTNSRFKHGKSSIEEMAIEANEVGLVEIGVTDHGYQHLFRTSKEKLKEARKTVDEINKWSKTKVLLGVEANIISDDGTLDIDNETLSLLDILIIGYHRMTSTNFANFFGFAKKTKESKEKCTNAFINAIRRYPVTIVAHLDSVLETDLYEIGKVCRERGTMVEINNRHTKWTEKQMEDLIASGCMFVVSSDAHSRDQVGEVDKAFEYITKFNIPSERVANVKFSEEEKSEADRNFSAYQSVYEQLAKTKREKEFVIEKRNRTEITGKLSSEMEDELRKIASEQGLDYQEYKQETVDEEYMKNMSDEDIALIRQAEEYIRNKELEAIQKENGVENEEEVETFSFDDNHPLVRDSFEEKFQPFNKSVIGIEEDEKTDIRREESNIVIEDDEPENVNATAFDQLNSSSTSKMQMFKDIMSSGGEETVEEEPVSVISDAPAPQKVQTKQVFETVKPENFMESITRTKLVNRGKTVTVNEVEEQKAPEKKPVATPRNNSRRGALISVDSLIGGDKK